MTEKIYKYFSGDVLDLVFEREGFCGLKCSFPNDYNDPYELFLGVDLNISTKLLATYREIIREIPQYPTTCFSNSPVITPMWAHYARNHTGFVVEFDVACLKVFLKEAQLRSVTYKNTPDGKIAESLERSAVTMKPRHAVWLQQAVLSEAYFSKQTNWGYEQERRLVVTENDVENIHGSMILLVPINCITSIVAGSRITEKVKQSIKQIAYKYKISLYQAVIGKSNTFPFFSDGNNDIFVFNGNDIISADFVCSGCSEPIDQELELCAWCRITERHEQTAAMANSFRIMQHYGILDGYFDDVAKIERSRD